MRDSTRQIRSTARTALAALAAAALAWAWSAGPGAAAAVAQEGAPDDRLEEVSVRVGPGTAELSGSMADGSSVTVALEDGEVVVDGETAATYATGGELESAWRDFLRDRVDPGAANVAPALRSWSPPSGADSDAAAAISEALARIASAADAAAGAPSAGEPGPTDEEAGTEAGAQETDTAEIMDEEETRVVPSGRSLDDLRSGIDRLRDALRDIGRGAVDAAADASLVVHDDYDIESGRTVDGSVALLSGELTVSGQVDGDVLVLDGDLILEDGSRVGGDVLQVGGAVTNRGGTIGGQLVSVGGEEAISREMAERAEQSAREDREFDRRYGPGQAIGYAIWDNLREGFSKLSLTLSFFIVLAVLGAIPLYFARPKFETTARTARHSFGRSFLLGLAAQVLFLPALVVLAVGVLTIPLIPVFMVAVALAFAAGYVAVGYAVGDVVVERGYDWIRRIGSGPYRTLLIGLAALQVLYVVVSVLDFFGGVTGALYGLTWAGATTVTWIAFTAGFGAVALSYAGTRDDYAGPGGPGDGGGEPPVPPTGGESPPPPGPETATPSAGEAGAGEDDRA